MNLGNKYKANLALFLSAVLFSLFMGLRIYYPNIFWVQLFYAVSEAALVGGVADWFAVTAIFRKPLGFPYHTALIPRNRNKLVQAIANMVQNELLNTGSIHSKLVQIRFTDLFINWVENKQGKAILANLFANYVSGVVSKTDTLKLSQSVESIIKKSASAWDMVPTLRILGCYMLDHSYEKKAISFLLDQLKNKVQQPATQRQIVDYLQKQADQKLTSQPTSAFGWLKGLLFEGAKAFDAINFDDAAAALQQEVLEILQELDAERHPLRLWIKQELQQVIEHLGQDAAQSLSLNDWKNELIIRLDISRLLQDFFSMLLQSQQLENVQADLFLQQGNLVDHYKQLAKKSPLIGWVLRQIERYWELFLQDSIQRKWFEAYLQEAIGHIVDSQHEFIGTLVRDVLEQLSDDALNKFIEDKAGEDLQWVRINGAVVGGLVGLLLFLFLSFIYRPWVMPLVTPWMKAVFGI